MVFIMSEWKSYKIGDLCDPISDTYKGTDDMVVLINTSDVLDGKVLNHELVSNENLKGQFKKTFKQNDILYSEIRPANKRFAFIDFDNTEKYIASTKLMVLRPREDRVLPQYLFAILKSRATIDELQHLAETRSGTFPQITFSSELAPMTSLLPDFTTQKQIVSILSAIEDKIELNTAINENLHQLVAAYYAKLFGNFDYSATISDYADKIFSGGTPTTSNEDYWNGKFKWLSSGETFQKYIVDTEKTITQDGIDNSSTRLASKYDTVIASAGQGHTRGQTSMLLTDSYVNQSIIVVDSKTIYKPFVYWTICGRYEELRVISNSNSIRGSLTTKMISAFSAPKVDDILIRKFSELAWGVIYEIEKNCVEIIKLIALRDTLLPKLMNGEIDVSKVQI